MSAEQFIGTWKFISFEIDSPDGEVSYPWGKDLVGLHTWDETGHFAIQGGMAARERFASDDLFKATPEEALSAFTSYTGYFGTYEVDEAEGTITHFPIGAFFPNSANMLHKREYQFSGDQLTLIAHMNLGGESVVARLVWERISND